MALSGTIMSPIGNGTLQEQAPGSLVTTFEGTVQVDITRPNITVLSAGTNVFGDISGSWQPDVGGVAGSSPANYGGKGSISFASALVAIRNFSATASGGPERVTGVDHNGNVFFNSDETLTILSGNADYSYSAGIFGSGHGSQDASGYYAQNQAGNGYINYDGVSTLTLVAPIYVNYTVTFSTPIGNVTANLIVTGTLVGYASYPSVDGSISLGGTPLGTITPAMSDGSGLHNPTASPAIQDISTTVQADKLNLVADGAAFYTLGSNAAAVDSLALSDGLAVELFS
jgi:hypothetical protein